MAAGRFFLCHFLLAPFVGNACIDSPIIASFGTSCIDLQASITCEGDLHNANSLVSNGTLLKSYCPATCGNCANETFSSYATSVSKFSSYEGDIDVQGAVIVADSMSGNSLRLLFDLKGLEPGASGRIAIHEKSDCTNPGGYFYNKENGGNVSSWPIDVYSSDSNGAAYGEVSVTCGHKASSSQGHAVIISSSSGAEVSCGVLGSIPSAFIDTYPTYTGQYADISGYVAVTQLSSNCGVDASLELHYFLDNVDPLGGGLHIHEGESCSNTTLLGGHYYDMGDDPWTNTEYSTDTGGAPSGNFQVQCGHDVVQVRSHAVVAHNSSGDRIGCGLLAASAPTECGCDNVLGSGAVVDLCSVCGGDNSACVSMLLWAKRNSGAKCPEPLYPTEFSRSGDSPCLPNCRLQFYTDAEYKALDILYVVISVVGFVTITYTLLSVLSTEKKRAKKMILLLVGCSWGLSLPMAIQCLASTNSEGINGVVCDHDVYDVLQSESYSSAGHACIYQAVSIAYFGMCLSCWWFFTIVHLFFRVGAFKDLSCCCCCCCGGGRGGPSPKTDFSHHWKYYSVIAFGAPLIPTIAIAANQNYGHYGPIPYCFTDSEDQWLTWVFFYGPIIAMYTLGVTLLTYSLCKIYQSLRLQATFWQTLQIYYVQLMFIFVFSTFLLTIIIFRLEVLVNNDAYADSGKMWMSCLLQNWLRGISDPATNPSADNSMMGDQAPEYGCGSTVPHGVPLWMTYMITSSVAGQGLYIFLIYGMNMTHVKDWKKIFKNICRQDNAPTLRRNVQLG